MNIEEVKIRLFEIEKYSDDPSLAHTKEDHLFECFVEDIISGQYKSINEIINVAKEVIKVKDIKFDRWYY